MPTIVIDWNWEEAFDKFGFDDGDGLVLTDKVAFYLEELGFEVTTSSWSMHNTIIETLSYNGIDLLKVPTRITREVRVPELGYDNPRLYLRPGLVAALDAEFRD